MHYEDIERVKAHHVNTFAQRQYVIERGVAVVLMFVQGVSLRVQIVAL